MSATKKRQIERSTDPKVWKKWFDELSEEEIILESDYDESDPEEVDKTWESNHETDSEQEAVDSSDDESGADDDDSYLGKDGTRWRRSPLLKILEFVHVILLHILLVLREMLASPSPK